MDNNINENKRMDEMKNDMIKMENRMYGKPFVDSSHNFIKREESFYKTMVGSINGIENLNDKQYDDLVNSILCVVSKLTRTAYLDGCLFGHSYKEDPHKTDDIIVDKNFMIMFDFHDNDFGQLVKDAAIRWCEIWNGKVNSIAIYKDCNSKIMCDDLIDDLNNLENLTNVSRIITNGICAANIDFQNEYDRFSDKTVPVIETLLDDCKSHVAYLDSLNLENYHKGNIKDIEQYAINEYKDMQDDGDKTPFDKLWLNGEVLFIKVEHGYATVCVR